MIFLWLLLTEKPDCLLVKQKTLPNKTLFFLLKIGILKVSKNQNVFMKFLPKTNKIIIRISAHYIIGQKSWQ